MAQLDNGDITSSKLLEKTTHFNEGGDAVDQLIYQLVRVDDDGTVIPASEDEVIEMESILGGTLTHMSDSGPQQMQLKDVEDLLFKQIEDLNSAKRCRLIGKKEIDAIGAEQKKLLTQLTFLDALLQKLKDDDQRHPAIDITCSPEMVKYLDVNNTVSTVMDFDCKPDSTIPTTDNTEGHEPKQIVFVDATSGNDTKDSIDDSSNMCLHDQINISNIRALSGNCQMHDDEMKMVIGEDMNPPKVQKNENLEKLSIRELHETFQSTFGRSTSVKDKRWLIRRISRAIEGSLEATGINIVLDESSVRNNAGYLHTPVINLSKQKVSVSKTGNGANIKRKLDERKKVIKEKMHSSLLETKFLKHKKRSPRKAHQFNGIPEIALVENKDLSRSSSSEGKRKRTPTKRYIEELTSSEMREGVVSCSTAATVAKISQSLSDKRHKEKHDLIGVPQSVSGKYHEEKHDSVGVSQSVSVKCHKEKKLGLIGVSQSVSGKCHKEKHDLVGISQSVSGKRHKEKHDLVRVSQSVCRKSQKEKHDLVGVSQSASVKCDKEKHDLVGVSQNISGKFHKERYDLVGVSKSVVSGKCSKEKHDLVRVTDFSFTKGYRSQGRLRKASNIFSDSSSSEKAAKLVRKGISVCTARLSRKSTSNGPRTKMKGVYQEPSKGLKRNTKRVTKILDVKHIPEIQTDLITKAEKRKKHHHPWTLKEVMKLLEGITHCGVGKWAEIKRYSFSNSVYRSSTDLKDKWRNLVRASNTHLKMLSQVTSERKQPNSHIPGPILVRVYELAELATKNSSDVNMGTSIDNNRNGHRKLSF